MQAARQPQALREQQPDVLQIALAPAPVALEVIDQSRRRGSRSCRRARAPCQTSQPARRSSAASTKSWLMIWPPSGGRPGKIGRPQCSHERPHADDRVMTPVIAVGALSLARPRRVNAAIDPGRRTAGCARTASRRRPAWAPPGSTPRADWRPSDRPAGRVLPAGHQAVGIEHDHIVVERAPVPCRTRRCCRSCGRLLSSRWR